MAMLNKTKQIVVGPASSSWRNVANGYEKLWFDHVLFRSCSFLWYRAVNGPRCICTIAPAHELMMTLLWSTFYTSDRGVYPKLARSVTWCWVPTLKYKALAKFSSLHSFSCFQLWACTMGTMGTIRSFCALASFCSTEAWGFCRWAPHCFWNSLSCAMKIPFFQLTSVCDVSYMS